ncbi:MAG: leucine--tRNA ligase [Patescibacteria group bacterium]
MPTYQDFLDNKGEIKWQQYWETKKLFLASDKSDKPKYYCLVEFPYPSGDGLHVGHPRPYTALDILARKRRMQGYNVLYPIGFDAFGLPSENYAIKTGIHPAIVTKKNIDIFTKQIKALGLSFDWSRVIETTDPKYYKWTQWIFLQMYKHGLAYKAKIAINWCLSCKIGLANEEVVGGVCERCGGKVEKREKEQWMLRITKYADRLIKDLDTVDYLEKIKTSQINWIGRSEGAEIDFKIVVSDKREVAGLKVFTTRPDTLFGVTFMVIAPEHELLKNQKLEIRNQKDVEKYIQKSKSKSDLERTELNKEKTGVEIEGIKAINPVNQEEIPVFVADYVLANYGTGAVMAVPGHDQRDWEFAKKYNLPIVEVIAGGNIKKEAYTEIDDGVLVNSGEFTGLSVIEAIAKITKWLEKHHIGKSEVNYKLRDWVFSRQRYWGEPIPMVFCKNCKETGASANGWVPVSDHDLPIKLPEVKKYEPTDNGESPLAEIKDWVNTKCPVCGSPAKRETDTMPNWAGSNWYFLRYIDPKNDKHLADHKKLEHWAPVDWYNGGMEHTTLHLLYSRFVYKFLWDIGAVPKSCGPEPYQKRTAHGMILGQGGIKMSKSKGNVINPDQVVNDLGADTLRVYEMFMGPFDQAIPWDTKGVIGVRRFIEKVWSIYNGEVKIVPEAQKDLIFLANKTIRKIGHDIETQDYNTAISALMILANKIIEIGSMDKDIAEVFLKILSPFAPHVTEELWQQLGQKKSISQEEWPQFNPALIKEEEVDLVVQVNGKFRDRIRVPADITEQRAETLARESEKVNKYLADKTIKNIIFVPGRLINFVV